MQVKLRCGGVEEAIRFAGSRQPTVLQALDAIGGRYPQVAASWREEDGRLRDSLAVFVNGEHVRYRSGFETILKDGDELYVIPLIAGG